MVASAADVQSRAIASLRSVFAGSRISLHTRRWQRQLAVQVRPMPALTPSLRPAINNLAGLVCGRASPCPVCRATVRHMLDQFLSSLPDRAIEPRQLRARLIIECTDA